MIEIASLRSNAFRPKYLPIRIDRSSVLGNPYVLKKESDREEVIAKYELHLRDRLKNPKDPITIEFYRILALSKTTNLSLMCWCAPKPCHGEVIVRLLQEFSVSS